MPVRKSKPITAGDGLEEKVEAMMLDDLFDPVQSTGEVYVTDAASLKAEERVRESKADGRPIQAKID